MTVPNKDVEFICPVCKKIYRTPAKKCCDFLLPTSKYGKRIIGILRSNNGTTYICTDDTGLYGVDMITRGLFIFTCSDFDPVFKYCESINKKDQFKVLSYKTDDLYIDIMFDKKYIESLFERIFEISYWLIEANGELPRLEVRMSIGDGKFALHTINLGSPRIAFDIDSEIFKNTARSIFRDNNIKSITNDLTNKIIIKHNVARRCMPSTYQLFKEIKEHGE